MTLDPASIVLVGGLPLRADPAREPCFTVAHRRAETHVGDDMSETSRREKLHADVNQEVQSLEIAAQSLVDFPEAPWELRLALARQCWDETRHARLCAGRLARIGGRKGEFPIINHEWSVVCALDSLPARLAVQNRTFEAGSMDLFRKGIQAWRDAGDDDTAEIMETILVDEIQHVRFANQWLRRIVQDDPRVALQLAAAFDYLRRVTVALAPREGDVSLNGVDLAGVRRAFTTNAEDRRFAAFSDEEIAAVRTPGEGSAPTTADPS